MYFTVIQQDTLEPKQWNYNEYRKLSGNPNEVDTKKSASVVNPDEFADQNVLSGHA